MAQHPALTEGRVAVITGAASGIGLAAAKRFAATGLRVCLADLGGGALEQAAAEVALVTRGGPADVLAVPTDVSKLEEVQRLKPTNAPHTRFLFVGSRLCSTLPSDGSSRFRPCALLVLHLHQVAQGTFTPKLSDMSDTQPGPTGPRLRRLRA